MNKSWIMADLHLGHQNILKHRPQFETLEEHDSHIIDNILSVVNKQDTLWMLGDIAFTHESLEKLRIIAAQVGYFRLVLGNHDAERQSMHIKDYLDIFSSIHGIVKKKHAWLTHVPMHEDSLRGCVNIHGHIHAETIDDPRYHCVSVEHTDYKPVRLDRLLSELQNYTN